MLYTLYILHHIVILYSIVLNLFIFQIQVTKPQWRCGTCSAPNFLNRDRCRKCDVAKPANAGLVHLPLPRAGAATHKREWSCPQCQVSCS